MDAKPFARELALLPELPQRERKVAERLQELPVRAAVELLHDLVRLAEASDDDARVAMLACVGLNRYQKQVGYERLADLYCVADELGYEDVKRLVATSEVSRRAAAKDKVENEHLAGEKTLGERKSLARTRDRDLLDRMMFDRNPEVIRVVLENARLTERDAVKLAAMRPTTPAVLDEVLRSPRWSPRYRVKKALVFNPYLPTHTAISLLPYLQSRDLREVAGSLELSEKVREAAREMLTRRRGGTANS